MSGAPPLVAEVEFAELAESLRSCVLAYYRLTGEEPEGANAQRTLDTNSTLVEQRANSLLRIAIEDGGGTLRGRRVLDLGCGFGALAVYFAAHGAEVVGIDANGERIAVGREVAARHGLDARFRRGRFERLDVGAREFDVVLHNNSLCYVIGRETRRRALAEARCALRPGGLLLMRNPNRWNPRDQFTGLPLITLLPPRAAWTVARGLGRKRSRVRLTSPPAARRELRAAGFSDVRPIDAADGSGRLRAVARYQQLSARRPS